MSTDGLTILVVGATGSIGRLVVSEALNRGHKVRALVRDAHRARALGENVELVLGDLAEPESLTRAVADVDAVVFTHGSDGGGKLGAERIDYGGVRNVLSAVGPRNVRIALMTAIGVTNRTGHYNVSTQAHDWKRRAERLVRVSGHPYTIVRPGWFDYNDRDQHHLVFAQGDRRQTGTPADGAIARRQIAEVLVASLVSPSAERKTLELTATKGAAQTDLDPLFAALRTDTPNRLDAVLDADNMPLDQEPERVLAHLDFARAQARPEAIPAT